MELTFPDHVPGGHGVQIDPEPSICIYAPEIQLCGLLTALLTAVKTIQAAIVETLHVYLHGSMAFSFENGQLMAVSQPA